MNFGRGCFLRNTHTRGRWRLQSLGPPPHHRLILILCLAESPMPSVASDTKSSANGGAPAAASSRVSVVVSTWSFGVAANRAVQQSPCWRRPPHSPVRHPVGHCGARRGRAAARTAEADPGVDSVGFGGRPIATGMSRAMRSIWTARGTYRRSCNGHGPCL
jgi:hypothetical protein